MTASSTAEAMASAAAAGEVGQLCGPFEERRRGGVTEPRPLLLGQLGQLVGKVIVEADRRLRAVPDALRRPVLQDGGQRGMSLASFSRGCPLPDRRADERVPEGERAAGDDQHAGFLRLGQRRVGVDPLGAERGHHRTRRRIHGGRGDRSVRGAHRVRVRPDRPGTQC